MMEHHGYVPNDNQPVIRMLAREIGRCNKGRNRILAGAVCLCVVTLTMVFGISFGKVRAEYTRAVRAAGTAASACIEGAGPEQYEKVRTLSYVKEAGRSVPAGEGIAGEGDASKNTDSRRRVCRILVLDGQAWEKIVKPAYTDISGHYPENGQELMLPVKALKTLGISKPEMGMKIVLTVNIGLFRTQREEFLLCGWYTDYTEDRPGLACGYISEEKSREWGIDIERKSDILICPSDSMDWRETEKRLYEDVPGEIKLSVQNTAAHDAVRLAAGGYDTAVLGAAVVLGGMFFLVYNVMGISMAGDIRQMGLLNTIGTTGRQICKVYLCQMINIVALGAAAGAVLASAVLWAVIPEILGSQYLRSFGGAGEVRFFYVEILAAAVAFAALLTFGVSAWVIFRTVNMSCVESVNYTGIKPGKRKTAKMKARAGCRRRSAKGELLYLAWQNVTRYRGRFALTVFSMFLGVSAFFGALYITEQSDYTRVIGRHPDFLIAGKFSRFGQEVGHGAEYTFRDAGKDPLETDGDSLDLLDDNYYDEYSPISPEVRERILSLEGVKRETAHVTEGAYMITMISRKAVLPFTEESQGMESIGQVNGSPVIEGFGADVIQILSREEIAELKRYVKEHRLGVDMDSLEDGAGVVILHDHGLSPKQEKEAAGSVGEPVYFTALGTKEEMQSRMRADDVKEWEQDEVQEPEGVEKPEGIEKEPEIFSLCGYLDNRAEGFPRIRQTWHGSEGLIYFLISEEGFGRLPAKKKTLCMELDAEEEMEPEVKRQIINICLEENKRREEVPGTGEDGSGEAGIFAVCKSELLAGAEGYIRGSRMIFGSISAVLLFAGLTNFLNVMVTGVISRRKELEVMECVGMTKRQRRRMLMMEGMCYFLAAGVLVGVIGGGALLAAR